MLDLVILALVEILALLEVLVPKEMEVGVASPPLGSARATVEEGVRRGETLATLGRLTREATVELELPQVARGDKRYSPVVVVVEADLDLPVALQQQALPDLPELQTLVAPEMQQHLQHLPE